MASELMTRLEDRRARIAVLGQGYVGLVVAMRASEAGFEVVGFEVDDDRAERLRSGESYVEDVPDEVLRSALARGYHPTTDPRDLAGFDVAVVSVPTPLSEGAPDLTFIRDAGHLVAEHLRDGTVVILESTTYPGTTEELLLPILEHGSGLTGGEDFLLGYSPERIDPGNGDFSLTNTPKVVAGVTPASRDAVDAFFSTFVAKTVPVSGCGEAELSKVIENTFRHVNIALVNEIAMFARDLGVDVNEAIDAAATKPFGFMTFRPGPGVGGHCLPIDPSYLSWKVRTSLGENFRFIELANDINEHMPHYVVRRVTAALNDDRKPVNGSRIIILGASYKPDVGDLRESPARRVVEQLRTLGGEVTVVEPHVDDTTSFAGAPLRTALDAELIEQCDLAVLLTDHAAFDYGLLGSGRIRLLDTRNRFPRGTPGVERL